MPVDGDKSPTVEPPVPPTWEQNRARIGIALLVLGLMMVLWAWGSWVYRISAQEQAASTVVAPKPDDPTDQQLKAAGGMRLLLMVVLVLTVVVLAGSYAVLRAGRRFRAAAQRARAAPTAYDDVWSRHRVPPVRDASEKNEP